MITQDQGVDTTHQQRFPKTPRQSKNTGSLCFHSQVVQVTFIPIYRQKLVAWQCLPSKRAEKAILPSAQYTNTLNYLTSSNRDYQSLSCGHQISGSLSLLQTKYIHALPPPSKEENPNALSWSYLRPVNLKVCSLCE